MRSPLVRAWLNPVQAEQLRVLVLLRGEGATMRILGCGQTALEALRNAGLPGYPDLGGQIRQDALASVRAVLDRLAADYPGTAPPPPPKVDARRFVAEPRATYFVVRQKAKTGVGCGPVVAECPSREAAEAAARLLGGTP